MTGRGRGRSGGPRGPPPQGYGVGRGSRGPPGAQNLRPPPPPPGAPPSRLPPPGGPSSRPPAPRRPVPANLSNIEDAESIAAGSGSTVSSGTLAMSSLSTGDVTSSSISLGLEASKKSSSSDSPEETKAEVDVSRIMGGAKMEEDLSKLVLKEPVKFQGKGGKMLNVTSNYLRIEEKPNTGVYEYEVRFIPNVDMRNERFRLIRQIEPIIGDVRTFDGVKLFLPKLLADKSTICDAVNVDGSSLKIVVNFKKKLELCSREMIQQFNIIFKRIFNVLKFKMHNRNFYDPESAEAIKQHNLSIWPGYVTAIDHYEGGLLLQCDISHRVLRTETVRDALTALKKRGGDLKTEAEKALLGVSILTRYNNASYKIDDIDWSMNPESTFTNSKGETMSFIDYYKRQYQIDIQDRKQPLLVNRPTLKKRGLAEAEADRVVCLIPELCMMTGLTDAMRSDFRLMQAVANITRISPQARVDRTYQFLKRIKANPEAHKLITSWGLDIAAQTIPLVARVLSPETLFFGRGKQELIGIRGDWNRAATSSVLTPVNLTRWALFYPKKNETAVQGFCKMMQQMAQKMGITFANPKPVSLPDDRTETYVREMRKILDPQVQLVLMVVPAQKSDRYAAIKKLCCIESPVPSQVVCLKTISNEKRLSAVAQKIALQINCKLGGELWACKTPLKQLMVVGIDVYHDKSRKMGSIAGVVASLNDSLSRYFSTVAIQKQGQEIIDALKIAFMQSLIRYYEVNNCFPETVVVYRDGVSDSQMDTVAKHEGNQFRNTFKMGDEDSSGDSSSGSESDLRKRFRSVVPTNYNPRFVYIVVQKRISTRIMMRQDRGNNVENPPPGTILDHTVTRYEFKDFFLVPQAVNQGTVTPTHMVVTDENYPENEPELSADIIQQLAYKLTHMYFNWPGTVRVPAPCQYAHKLCDLVGEHLKGQPSQTLNDKLYYL